MYFSLATLFVSALTLLSGVRALGPRTQCVETYRISNGDTCSSIGSWSGVTPSQIESLNPGMNCNSVLKANTYICMGSYTPVCTLNETATDTLCDALAAQWEITVDDFVQYNDNVDNNCDNLVVGQPYCVSITGCFPGNTDAFCDQ
ncbi:hypothetical protein BC834DRAFT_970064 [Gloeopeniophorella convolvens]|nr:hypothetical protein BC834DRAFT_970064 [Gloeopeniophorella convolvens]